MIILPVFAAGEAQNGIDVKDEFKGKNIIFTQKVKRNGEAIEFNDEFGVKHRVDSGLVIGFGAGDITYQLRNES